MTETPSAPVDLREGGLRLWDSITAAFELDEHEMVLLLQAARTVDLLDELAVAVQRDGALIAGDKGGERVHPAAVEARQQRIALARLIAAIRLPAGAEGDHQQGARPQRRVGVRGVYGVVR